MIRTGILCVPEYDEEAVHSVRRCLGNVMDGAVVLLEQSAPSQRYLLEDLLRRWSDEEELDLILTIGGTLPAPGPSSREITPEATLAVAERQMPGLAEAMRAFAQDEIGLALLDRGASVIRGRSLILNLPAGAGPARLFLEAIVDVLPTVVAHLQDDPAAPTLANDLGQADGENVADPAPESRSGRLDADEFAEFLRRREEGNR